MLGGLRQLRTLDLFDANGLSASGWTPRLSCLLDLSISNLHDEELGPLVASLARLPRLTRLQLFTRSRTPDPEQIEALRRLCDALPQAEEVRVGRLGAPVSRVWRNPSGGISLLYGAAEQIHAGRHSWCCCG